MVLREGLPGDARDDIDQPIDRHHLVRSDVDRSSEFRAHQPYRAGQTFINVEKRAGLFSVAPDLHLAPIRRHCHLTTHGSRRLLLTVVPSPLRSEDVVVSGDPRLYAVIATIRQIKPLAEQL